MCVHPEHPARGLVSERTLECKAYAALRLEEHSSCLRCWMGLIRRMRELIDDMHARSRIVHTCLKRCDAKETRPRERERERARGLASIPRCSACASAKNGELWLCRVACNSLYFLKCELREYAEIALGAVCYSRSHSFSFRRAFLMCISVDKDNGNIALFEKRFVLMLPLSG